MMRRSRSSTVRAGVTGPRGGSSFSASTLRNAWESYQETTHSVNGLDFGQKIADVEPMPRTPLLRALRRLADEHREADRLGIPAAELQARVTQCLVGGQPDDPIGDQTAALLEGAHRVFDGEVKAIGIRLGIRWPWEQALRGQHRPELRHRRSGVAAAQQLHSPSLLIEID